MNDLTTQAPQGELIINSHSDTPVDTTNLVINPQAFYQLTQFANMMAGSKMTVPAHLRGNSSDCLAVCMQAMQWGMNPFAVAQKTFHINGVLGYEAQLVNAVITSRAPVKGRLQFEWFGEWERIIGRFKESNGKITKDWTLEDEKGLGVRVWATLKGEDEPRVLELLLSQAGVRNSPLWGQDPKQQLAYLAIKRWSRLYCPDVILGVYTPDEIEPRDKPKDVTSPRSKHAGTSSIKDRIKAKKAEPEVVDAEVDCFDIEPKAKEIAQATTLERLNELGKDIATIKETENLCGDDLAILQNAWKEQKSLIIYNDLLGKINQVTPDTADVIRAELFANQKFLSEKHFSELDDTLDNALNAQVAG